MSHQPSPLRRTVTGRPTDFWNDSCAPDELQYAIDHGAVGATSNPTIVVDGVKKDPERWKNHIAELILQNPSWTEVDIAWKVSEEFAVAGAKLMEPIFQETEGKKGHLSIQTNPQYFCSKDALVKQAVYFNTLAPNLHVKAPATDAGVQAMEEMTYQGVRINATVSFTVPQVVTMAEGVDRALRRREEEGKSNDHMHPVITMMVGRLDDWLKVVAAKEGRVPTPGVLDWAGVACFKNAYKIFQQKGYRARLLAAAYRNHLHWSQFIGGDVVLTIPSGWQKKFNKSNVEVKDRIDDPVPQEILDELNTYEDFRRAYSPDGMTTEEFDSFGATRRTLIGFLSSYAELLAFVRNEMVPNPD